LEEFTPDEVEAVFGHEVGHVKHAHMLCYLGFIVLSLAVMFGTAAAAAQLLGDSAALAPLKQTLTGDGAALIGGLPALLGLLAYVFVAFGFLSRRCERQADVYGCRAASCGRPDCDGHGPNVELAPRGRGLCPTGVRTFVRALEKVCVVNGISRDRPGFLQSWQHGSIARRVAFLQGMLHDPAAEPRFQRRVALLKWGLLGVLGAALVGLVIAFPTLLSDQNSPAGPPAGAPDQAPASGAAADGNPTAG
jgi:STE24 endopeptidase